MKKEPKPPVQEWEKPLINALTMKFIFAATGGTLAATGLSYILRISGFGEIKPELLFMPWGVALVLGVSVGFHQGVLAERRRQNKDDSPNSKE